ncbi:PLP-dependent transferase [Wallemia mellicola]|uniref:alanine--glyoxylate transaminase n=1 Tax=Wallemia mellicola TaxID=1708541 RepID=A0AB38N1K2_9BASI|nr:hypothetical protein E3Q24_00422 [Wallemia mellicola]TIB89444.1 PLP-dependent transferase [Wallemia mellicola]TIB91881.1 PLP-dependent transferase [Wallemia mellicola]TIC26376.1 PLP-dependent transferase [Wallemia mellicola]TIC43108.1 PLP-dependent transferase [Wallemia mellicola]
MTSAFKQADHPLLAIPGPVEISDEVLLANAHPSVSHVSPSFVQVFGESLKLLKELVYSKSAQPFIISGSGTLGWDQAASNLIEIGDNALVINTGYFGDELGNCLSVYGANVDHLNAEIGKSVPLDKIRETLKEKKYKMVTITHVDTSTGVLSDAKGIARVIRESQPNALVVLDGVCSVASELIKFDEWGIDVLISASQKGIGAPPGLSLVWASERAISIHENRKTPASGYYVNWKRWIPVMKAYEENKPAYFATPPVQLVFALNTTLKSMLRNKDCSLEKRFEEHKKISKYFKKEIQSWGLKQLVNEERYEANGMTTIMYPEGVKGSELLPKIAKSGIVVGGGLHKQVKDEYFRVGHMGETVVNDQIRGDINKLLRTIQECLN